MRCRPVALASAPGTGELTTISMRDQKRCGSLLVGALPSRRLKKLPQSPRNAKVVKIIKDYRDTMQKAGPPYRYA